MICRDAIKLEAPAAQGELTLLLSMKVGDTRQSVLFPALDGLLEWTLTSVVGDCWTFAGRFFGQPLYTLVIRKDAALLTLEVTEGV